MSTLTDDYYLTHHEDDNGAEWEIRVYFEFQASENAEYEEGMCVYPGCDEEVTVNHVERNEPVYDVPFWYEFDDFTVLESNAWESEILEKIHERAHDDRGNEL